MHQSLHLDIWLKNKNEVNLTSMTFYFLGWVSAPAWGKSSCSLPLRIAAEGPFRSLFLKVRPPAGHTGARGGVGQGRTVRWLTNLVFLKKPMSEWSRRSGASRRQGARPERFNVWHSYQKVMRKESLVKSLGRNWTWSQHSITWDVVHNLVQIRSPISILIELSDQLQQEQPQVLQNVQLDT